MISCDKDVTISIEFDSKIVSDVLVRDVSSFTFWIEFFFYVSSSCMVCNLNSLALVRNIEITVFLTLSSILKIQPEMVYSSTQGKRISVVNSNYHNIEDLTGTITNMEKWGG